MKKILSLILVLSLLTPLIPAAPVHANVATDYKYVFNVKTRNGEHAGTDDVVHMGVSTYETGEQSDHTSRYAASGTNFNANTEKQYDFWAKNVPPWRMNEFVFWLEGSDEWEVDFVTLWLPFYDGKINPTQAKTLNLYTATKNRGRMYRDISDVTKRKFVDIGNVDKQGGEFYLDPSSNLSGSEGVNWDKKVNDQYGHYDIMQYDDAPVFSYTVSNDAVGRNWLTFTEPTKTQNFILDIDRKKLHDAMVAAKVAEVSLTYRVALLAQSTNAESLGGTFAHTTSGNVGAKSYLTTKIGNQDYYYKDVTYTFYRNIYELGNAQIHESQRYFHMRDNLYLNRKLSDVTITVEPISIHRKSMTPDEKIELITNFQATPVLYLGNNTTTPIANLTMTKLKGNDGKLNGILQFTGKVAMDVSEVEGEGVRLQLDNVSTHLTKKGKVQAYQLEYPTEESKTSQSFYFSTTKVDTTTPTVRVTDQYGIDLAGGDSIQNNIKKMHEFYMVSSETLYHVENASSNFGKQNYFRYELYKKVNDAYAPTKIRITNFDGTGDYTDVTAPINTQVLKGVSIKLRPLIPTEGDFKLRVYGWDKANNPLGGETGYVEYENIKFDNQAPRVTITETVHPQDEQLRKRNDYSFEMTDLQQSNNGWSRTYYTFMNGTATPTDTPIDQINPVSEEIASTQGMWAFIDSKGDSSTAIISIPKGEDFNGNLYYFTVDSIGNDSRNEQTSKYYKRPVTIMNGNVVDTLITEDASLPKPRFTMKFDDSNPNLVTSYRWIAHPSNTYTPGFEQVFRDYINTQDVGAEKKIRKGSGIPMWMDGKYILEYKVTDTVSGNFAEFSRVYHYDLFEPKVSFTMGELHDRFKTSHQLNVKVTDDSGVASAYYYLSKPEITYKIDGTPEYPLPLTLNSENVAEVDQTLTITGIPTGSYSIVVVAKDPHGRETVSRSPYFSIRSGPVRIDQLEHKQPKTINGMGATTDGTYNVFTFLTEPHKAWISQPGKYQKPVFYATTDGNPTGNGVIVEGVTPGNNFGGAFLFTLNTPLELQEGVNKIYLQFGLINYPDDEKPEFLTDARPLTILYDSQAPTFELPDYSTIQPTKESVTATIVANDVGTGISKLTVAPEDAGKISISPYTNGAFTVTIRENVTTNLTLEDALGNKVLVPISVTNIDKKAPSAIASSEIVTNGAREDGVITVDVADESETTVSFALIQDPTEQHALTEEDYELFSNSQSVSMQSGQMVLNGEGKQQKTYTIALKGLSGTYAIGIKAIDTAGNVTEKVFYSSRLNLVDAEASITSVNANPTTTKTTSTVTVSFNVPVTVMPYAPNEGDVVEDMAKSNLLYTGLLSTSAEYVMDYDVVIQNNNPVSLYIQDEAGRDAVVEFTPDVEFVAGFDITGHVEKNGQTIQNGGFISYNQGDTLYYVVVPNPNYSGQYFFVENVVLSGLELNTELSVVDSTYKGGGTGYSKLVFEALRDGKTTKSAYFEAYTTEGMEADRMEDEYVAISVVDETAPTVSVSYSTTEPTNQNVNAVLSISDPESGILRLERSYDGINYSQIDSIISHTETFSQNATVYFKVTNKAGMTAVVPVEVSNIDKTSITEDVHYTVEYTYENYLGNWVPIQEGKAYRRVMATLKFIGEEKTLSMTNNSGALSRTLTQDVNTFTFQFRDRAGNTASHTVSYDHFDNTIGDTSYVLSNTAKTNQNIFATITLTDDSGEIAFAEVKKGDVVYPFKGEPLENEYVVELDSSGIYYVTAYDYAGNKWTSPITVSNINKVVPTATAKTYSTLPSTITTQSVNVELTQFSKDIKNITVTGVERTGSLTANDIVHIPGTKAVRFKKNGTVTMFFVDDYGNEGHEVITISNIVSTPPQIQATAALAENKLSVNVTFDQIRDSDGVPLDILRKLTDLRVSYRGYEHALLTEVKDENGDVVSYKDAVINVKTNGEHVFLVRDKTGLTQKILLTVQGIEVGKPSVKEVRWTYKYLEQNQKGEWVEKDHQNKIVVGVDTSGKEAGYVVGIDKNPTTNQNVNVTVITDKDAKFIGGKDPWAQEKSMNYRENGLYNFNLEGRTGDYISYGVNIGLIDKTPPVLKLKNGEELIFIEGMTPKKDASIAYDKSKLLDFEAWDEVAGKKVDLTKRVTINYGAGGRVFNPDNISANEFIRSNPYYIDYTVSDDAGNQTTIRRTVRLVGLYDTIALINGVMPDSTNTATVLGNKVEISLKNFSGISYARYEKGILTQGQMKTKGTVLREKNGVFTMDNVAEGWYTVYIQTDKRDYFNISVYVSKAPKQGGK